MKQILKLVFTVLLLVSGMANAGDGLYGKVPPTDAAFFRFVNISSQAVDIEFKGKKIATVSPFRSTAYGFESAGDFDFKVDGNNISKTLKADDLTTIIWNGEDAQFIIESPFTNKRKARVKLYNLTDSIASLLTIDGKHKVIESVESFSAEFRDVNALDIAFKAITEQNDSVETSKIKLAREKVTSIFVYKQNGLFGYFDVGSLR